MARRYKANPVHRNGTPCKTQWHTNVPVAEEETIFRVGEANNWFSNGDIFSLKTVNNVPVYLDSAKKLRYARYMGDNHSWHGFPANGKLHGDVPEYAILRQWANLNYTTRAKVAKLRRRQACSI